MLTCSLGRLSPKPRTSFLDEPTPLGLERRDPSPPRVTAEIDPRTLIFLTVDLKEYNRAELYEAYREEELKSWIQENITKEQEGTLSRKYEKFGVFAPQYLRREPAGKPDYLSFKEFCRKKIRGGRSC